MMTIFLGIIGAAAELVEDDDDIMEREKADVPTAHSDDTNRILDITATTENNNTGLFRRTRNAEAIRDNTTSLF
jgi:hypothetical protein